MSAALRLAMSSALVHSDDPAQPPQVATIDLSKLSQYYSAVGPAFPMVVHHSVADSKGISLGHVQVGRQG